MLYEVRLNQVTKYILSQNPHHFTILFIIEYKCSSIVTAFAKRVIYQLKNIICLFLSLEKIKNANFIEVPMTPTSLKFRAQKLLSNHLVSFCVT